MTSEGRGCERLRLRNCNHGPYCPLSSYTRPATRLCSFSFKFLYTLQIYVPITTHPTTPPSPHLLPQPQISVLCSWHSMFGSPHEVFVVKYLVLEDITGVESRNDDDAKSILGILGTAPSNFISTHGILHTYPGPSVQSDCQLFNLFTIPDWQIKACVLTRLTD